MSPCRRLGKAPASAGCIEWLQANLGMEGARLARVDPVSQHAYLSEVSIQHLLLMLRHHLGIRLPPELLELRWAC